MVQTMNMPPPPWDGEAEQSVLGAILLRAAALDEVADLLIPDDFYRTAHGQIYRVMLALYNQERPVDLVTVTARLKELEWLDNVGGAVFLAGLSEHVGTAANVGYYREVGVAESPSPETSCERRPNSQGEPQRKF